MKSRRNKGECAVWRKPKDQSVSIPCYTLSSFDSLPRVSTELRRGKLRVASCESVKVVRKTVGTRSNRGSEVCIRRKDGESVDKRPYRRLSAGSPKKSPTLSQNFSNGSSLLVSMEKSPGSRWVGLEEWGYTEDSAERGGRKRKGQRVVKGPVNVRRRSLSPNHFLSNPHVSREPRESYPPPISIHSASGRPGPVQSFSKKRHISTRWKQRIQERNLATRVRTILKPDLSTDRNFRLVP